MTELPELSARIGRVLALDPSANAFEHGKQWHTWGELRAAADDMAGRFSPGQRVGVLLRNRPVPLGQLLGLLTTGACVVTINPGRGDDRVREDLASLDIPVLGEPADVEHFGVHGARATHVTSPGVAVELLTSGTTGPPKRVPLTYETFLRVLVGAKHYERNQSTDVQLRSGVVIVNAPLVHVGGLFRVLQAVNDGRSFCLLEKFNVDEWVDAVRRHRPKTVSLVPAALRMVLAADLDPDDLASIRSVVSGTAPLSPEDADAFYEKYGIPVLISYGATEFGGGVAGWNLADHERWWKEKRGSVGRAHAGCELRVVQGVLEVKARQLGDGWTRTTDLARIDEDGFLFILGRADQAIIRGGFKVQPDDVRAALERDPRVLGAGVVGIDDDRLGAVPVAVVELQPGAAATSDELLAEAAKVLSRYELPVELRILDALPRTASGKVDLPAVRALWT
jgi:acyl-CoA synthetase (AMP-forming)/AMP-acid ligase II